MATLSEKISFRFRKLFPKKEIYHKTSFSQAGEDILIDHIFQLRGIKNPTYIDIGANHPFYLNNTAMFYLRGSTGINVDANPNLIDIFNKKRNKDKNVNVGIGPSNAELDFYIMKDNTLSTFSESEYKKLSNAGHQLEKIEKVKIVPLQEILDKYNSGVFPDLLSLDVEGIDFEIIKSINFSSNNYPKVICVEAVEYSPIGVGERKSELIDYIIDKGYYEFANTNINSILVKKDFWFI